MDSVLSVFWSAVLFVVSYTALWSTLIKKNAQKKKLCELPVGSGDGEKQWHASFND